jgi:hypothetical protein
LAFAKLQYRDHANPLADDLVAKIHYLLCKSLPMPEPSAQLRQSVQYRLELLRNFRTSYTTS